MAVEYATSEQIIKFSPPTGDYNSLKTKFIGEVSSFCTTNCINCDSDKWDNRGKFFDYGASWTGTKFDSTYQPWGWTGESDNKKFTLQIERSDFNKNLLDHSSAQYDDSGVNTVISNFFTYNGINLQNHIATREEFFGFYKILLQFISNDIIRVFSQVPATAPEVGLRPSKGQDFDQDMQYFLYDNPAASGDLQNIDMFTDASNFNDILQIALDQTKIIQLKYSIKVERI